ncbi:MAG: hypothetical protein M5T61_19615 [Acidimicrobiia bacterium]|nr:hypothetical protein [Acidimicrobiia bacterium]
MRAKDLPKTKRGHMIALDAGTVEMLRNHRERQAEVKRLLGTGDHDDGWIFPARTAPRSTLSGSAASSSASRRPTTRPTPTSRSRG